MLFYYKECAKLRGTAARPRAMGAGGRGMHSQRVSGGGPRSHSLGHLMASAHPETDTN